MPSVKKNTSLVGLDLESGSIAATEVAGNGRRSVGRTAIVPLEAGVVREGGVQDPEALSSALTDLFERHKLPKTVRLGIANQRVVVRTLRLPRIEDKEELDAAVRFRAQDEIPMPLDQAVLDHRIIGRGESADGNAQIDVLAVAARRDMIHPLVQAMKNAGLHPAGIDLSAFGMIRALGPADGDDADATGELLPTTLYCHLGDVTNIAVARGSGCLFTRVSPFGVETIADRLASREGISLEDARERLMDVGLEEELDWFDDDDGSTAAREELERGAGKLSDELRMSMEFYGAQEGVTAVERVVVCGAGGQIPGLADRIRSDLGLEIALETPQELSHLDPEDAARLTVSYGLALGE